MEADTGTPFRPGDRVRVISGPFAGLYGDIRDVSERRRKLCAIIMIYDLPTPVELGFDEVALAD